MLRTIVIEDEKPDLEKFLRTLGELSIKTEVQATFSSVKESISHLPMFSETDLVFSDVSLPDGLSFEIFNQTGIDVPVIFVTRYDEHMLNRFENNGIDYLLKPVNKEDLDKAITKYQYPEKQWGDDASFRNFVQRTRGRKRTRLAVKKGLEVISLRLQDVVMIYTENKIVYAIDRWQKKYFVDKSLGELEADLDENHFFRVNRQFILNINFIRGFKPFDKVKLLVDLTLPDIGQSIIVSQETAPAFRKWIYEA